MIEERLDENKRLLYGSSSRLATNLPAMEGSLSPCRRAVAAPILRPQRAIVDVLPESLRCSITHYEREIKEGKRI